MPQPLPSSASFCTRVLRTDTSENSDATKKPFRMTMKKMRMKSPMTSADVSGATDSESLKKKQEATGRVVHYLSQNGNSRLFIQAAASCLRMWIFHAKRREISTSISQSFAVGFVIVSSGHRVKHLLDKHLTRAAAAAGATCCGYVRNGRRRVCGDIGLDRFFRNAETRAYQGLFAGKFFDQIRPMISERIFCCGKHQIAALSPCRRKFF